LEKMLEREECFHVRRNALTLVSRAEKWQSLPAILDAFGDQDVRIAELASGAIHDWIANYNRSYAEPSNTNIERIQASLSKVESKLPKRVTAEIKGCLKTVLK
jgi:hypothetical protein